MMNVPLALATALADRYRLERKLGEGGMASVYLATVNGQRCVLKRPLAELEADETFVKLFLAGARVLAVRHIPLLPSLLPGIIGSL